MLQQGSSARTGRRPSVVLPRSRVPRRRRTNKRIAHTNKRPGTLCAEAKIDNRPLSVPFYLSTSPATTDRLVSMEVAGGRRRLTTSVENIGTKNNNGFLTDKLQGAGVWTRGCLFYFFGTQIQQRGVSSLPLFPDESGITRNGFCRRTPTLEGGGGKTEGARSRTQGFYRACLSYTVCLRPALA